MNVCFIHPTKAYDSVDRTLLGTVLSGFDVPKTMIWSFVSSTMACELECGSTTGWARCGSLLNRALVKSPCSHPFCSFFSSRHLETWHARVSRLRKTSWTLTTHTFIYTYVAPQIPPVCTDNAADIVIREQITFSSYLLIHLTAVRLLFT